jgi:hypothetical protein
MNLPRLRELLKAWQDGSIREAELLELRDALPEVIAVLGKLLGRDFVSRPLVHLASLNPTPLGVRGYVDDQ